MRFDPNRRLAVTEEYYGWLPAAWPVTARSWKLRRAVGLVIDRVAALADAAAAAILRLADFVHGQPRVEIWRYTMAQQQRIPFAPRDVEFLAGYCREFPLMLAALDDELRAAVLETMKTGAVGQLGQSTGRSAA